MKYVTSRFKCYFCLFLKVFKLFGVYIQDILLLIGQFYFSYIYIPPLSEMKFNMQTNTRSKTRNAKNIVHTETSKKTLLKKVKQLLFCHVLPVLGITFLQSFTKTSSHIFQYECVSLFLSLFICVT